MWREKGRRIGARVLGAGARECLGQVGARVLGAGAREKGRRVGARWGVRSARVFRPGRREGREAGAAAAGGLRDF